MKQGEVYTDGACSGNPGPGGWGAVLRYRFNGKVYEKELSGGDDSTTNNRMELTAFIEALRQLKEPCEVRLCSDSQYVINGLQKGWAKNWQRRGWKKADGSPALNPDLWAQALEQEARHKITYVWVKGHAGHPHAFHSLVDGFAALQLAVKHLDNSVLCGVFSRCNKYRMSPFL